MRVECCVSWTADCLWQISSDFANVCSTGITTEQWLKKLGQNLYLAKQKRDKFIWNCRLSISVTNLVTFSTLASAFIGHWSIAFVEPSIKQGLTNVWIFSDKKIRKIMIWGQMKIEKSIVSNSADSSDKCKLFRYLNVVCDNRAKLDKTRYLFLSNLENMLKLL